MAARIERVDLTLMIGAGWQQSEFRRDYPDCAHNGAAC